jgi:hypothetical protein
MVVVFGLFCVILYLARFGILEIAAQFVVVRYAMSTAVLCVLILILVFFVPV